MINVKQWDLMPSPVWPCKVGGVLVDDLDVADEVAFWFRPQGMVAPVLGGAGYVYAAEAGLVAYDWMPGDTDIPGIFDAEFKVRWGSVWLSFPNYGYARLVITAAIRAPGPAPGPAIRVA